MPTHDLLNLPGFEVVSVQDSEHDYHIDAISTVPVEACPHCQYRQVDGFGRREQMVRDLPIHGKRVGIYIKTRRFRCKACQKTFYEALPGVNAKRSMTDRLVAWIGHQAVKRTFVSIAEEVGCVEGTVRLIFKDYIAALSEKIRFETPKWIGIDEIHLIRPRGVIANIQNNTIVELLHNRNKDTMVHYLSHLEGRDQVQYVAMDMWKPYRDAVEAVLPQARIIIDKFHVLRMANNAMEGIRKGYRETLTSKQRRGLLHDRFVLLKREKDLSDQESLTLSGWIQNYPELGQAYRLKEQFFGIYDAQTKADALQRYTAWEKSVGPDVREAYADLIRAWSNWQPYILNYFDHPVTNAYTESLNNLIRVMNRLGRGYSFEALRAKILFAEGAFKKQNIRPKFERRRSDEIGADAIGMIGYGTFNQQPTQSKEVNYGPDISTLVRMIEEGIL